LINGISRATFLDLELRDNNVLTIFAIGLIRTCRFSFISHISKGSALQKAFDDPFRNDLIPVSVKGS